LRPFQKQGNYIAKPIGPASCLENVILDFACIPIILVGTLNMNFIKRTIKQICIYEVDFE
jgi:hypothetical protein